MRLQTSRKNKGNCAKTGLCFQKTILIVASISFFTARRSYSVGLRAPLRDSVNYTQRQ